MTALNVIVRPDAVHVLTDGAAAEAGRQLYAAHKAMALPKQRAVLAVRGRRVLLPLIYTAIDGLPTLEELVDGLAAQAMRVLDGIEAEIGEPIGMTDILLAGWSAEDDEPAAYLTSNFDRPGLPAWEPAKVGTLFTPPTSLHLTEELAAALDPERDGVAIMREQRASRECVVGGFCQLTSVYRDRIETRVLERWV